MPSSPLSLLLFPNASHLLSLRFCLLYFFLLPRAFFPPLPSPFLQTLRVFSLCLPFIAGPTTFGQAGSVPSVALGNNVQNNPTLAEPTVPYIPVDWLNIDNAADCLSAMKSFDVSSQSRSYDYMGGFGGFYQAICGSNQRNEHGLCGIGDSWPDLNDVYTPFGCIAVGKELYFNSAYDWSNSPACHTTHNMWCLCKFDGNDCADGTGVTAGTTSCICGAGNQASVCTRDTGYYCNSQYSFCSPTPVQTCTESNNMLANHNNPIISSTANTGSCGCGAIENGMSACTPLTGLHCHFGIKRQGFCSKGPMVRTYVEIASATCEHHGYQRIVTRVDCEAAATYKGENNSVATYGYILCLYFFISYFYTLYFILLYFFLLSRAFFPPLPSPFPQNASSVVFRVGLKKILQAHANVFCWFNRQS